MKFRDARIETRKAVEFVCLLLSLGAIFFQIWTLATSLESHFQGHDQRLFAYMALSFIAFSICALTAWTTGMDFMKGVEEGRSKTYLKDTKFKS